jgi:hypothetical protein
MAADADKLRHDLGRYRAPLRCSTDKKVSEALQQMIAEIEGRLRRTAEGGPEPVC